MVDPPKRRRIQNAACDECRRRKIRCDSAEAFDNVCSNCLSLKIVCAHLGQNKKRGPAGPSVRALVQNILSTTTPFNVPEDLDVVKQMLKDLANHATFLDSQLTVMRRVASTASTASSPSPPASHTVDIHQPSRFNENEETREIEDSIDSLTNDLDTITITPLARHFGKSSSFMLVNAAIDARQTTVKTNPVLMPQIFAAFQRPQYWRHRFFGKRDEASTCSFIFPPDDLLQELIHVYFSNVNTIFPLFHRPTFERLIAERLHLRDPSFGATLLGICAVASRQMTDPRNSLEGPDALYGHGWKYFRQISLVRDFTEPPSVHYLQLCCLCVFYIQVPELSWAMIGIGIRSAHEIGIHRKRTNATNRMEDELWKRAFWVLISLDTFMSILLGRPRATTPDDFDVDLPIECDDEYWDTADPAQAFKQPKGKPSVVAFFGAFLRLIDIAGFAQRTLYGVRKSQLWSGMGISSLEWKRKAVMELDSALNKFVDEIPEHLKWNPTCPNPIFFQQSAMLWTIYHWVQIQVHRPFIPRPGRQSILPFPSLSVCCNAARSTLNMVEALQKRADYGTVPNLIILFPMFSATMVLLVNMWHHPMAKSRNLEHERDVMYLYQLLDMLKQHESRNVVAGRLVDLMHAITAICQIPLAGPSNPPVRTTPDISPDRPHSVDVPQGQIPTSLPTIPQASWGDTIPTYSPVYPFQQENLQSVSTSLSPSVAPPEPNVNSGWGSDYHNSLGFSAPNPNDPTCTASPPSSPPELTQADWDVFMANMDVFMATAAEY